MSQPTDLVLLTGATGYVGFRTLRYALDEGYNVRAVVRSQAKADLVKAALSRTKPSLKEGDVQLTFVVIPDLLAPGAFDSALEDVKYIIHIASPPPAIDADPSTDFEAAIVTPAVQMTLKVFEAAQSVSSVKRIVVTSSAGAIVPPEAWFQTIPTVGAEHRVPDIPGPFNNALFAYAASKIAALNRAEAWIKEQQPAFDVIHIHPTYVLGRDDLCTKPSDLDYGTNRLVLNHALGKQDPQVGSRGPYFNSVHDCAMVHVKSLDPNIKGNQSFITSSSGEDGMKWNHANEFVAKHFKQEVDEGILPNNGTTETIPNAFDVRKTEETFGFKHAGFEDLVVEVVGHWLELREKEKSGS